MTYGCNCKRHKQEQQRVAVGPGNAHFIFIRQVSYDVRRAHAAAPQVRTATGTAAAAGAAVYRQVDN